MCVFGVPKLSWISSLRVASDSFGRLTQTLKLSSHGRTEQACMNVSAYLVGLSIWRPYFEIKQVVLTGYDSRKEIGNYKLLTNSLGSMEDLAVQNFGS